MSTKCIEIVSARVSEFLVDQIEHRYIISALACLLPHFDSLNQLNWFIYYRLVPVKPTLLHVNVQLTNENIVTRSDLGW